MDMKIDGKIEEILIEMLRKKMEEQNDMENH
jgi:hypothetical protein